MNKHNAVAVRNAEDGAVTLHASADPGGNYGTLCGLSTDDDLFQTVDTPERSRINCVHCHGVWTAARGFKGEDLAPETQRKMP